MKKTAKLTLMFAFLFVVGFALIGCKTDTTTATTTSGTDTTT